MTDSYFIGNTYAPRRRRPFVDRKRPEHSCPVAFTDNLVVWPRIVDGFGSIADVFGSRWSYNYSASEEEADAHAVWSDWAVTGCDLKDAMLSYGEKLDSGDQLKSDLVQLAEKVTAEN